MEDDVGVRKLAELIFMKHLIMTEEIIQDSSFPTCLKTNEFSEKLGHVMTVRFLIECGKWMSNVRSLDRDVYSSPEKYVRLVLFACFHEYYSQPKTFDNFINICSVVKFFSSTIQKSTGVSYYFLNFDVVMEFYNTVLKKSFQKCGGFQRLVNYIQNHKYLSWDVDLKTYFLPPDPSNPLNAHSLKVKKEIAKEKSTFDLVKSKLTSEKNCIYDTTEKLVSTIMNKSLEPSFNQTNSVVDSSSLSEQVKTAEKNEKDLNSKTFEEVWQQSSNLKLDFKTDQIPEYSGDISRYDDVMKVVLRHNRSKISDLETSNNCTLQEADKILNQLENTIETLINVLD